MIVKTAKSSIAYGVLVIFLVIGIIALANLVIAFSQGNQDTGVTYRAIESGNSIAGRQYTPFCLTDCHLPVCFSYDGNSLPSSLNIGKQDLTQTLNFAQSADQSVLKETGIDYLATETYSVDVADYGTCTGQVLNNETGKYDDYAYSCVTGSHQEQRTREIWKPFKDISQLQLEKGKEFCFDIWGKLAIKPDSKFAVDVIPIVKLQNNQFSFNELAWWNNSVSFRRNHTGSYSFNATSVTLNFSCLINSSWGFGDGKVNNTIWGKCDTNQTQLYYNNASDYYLVNGSFPGHSASDLIQLPMDTEGKEGGYDYNADAVWDNFTLVLLAHENDNFAIGSAISVGQGSLTQANFTNQCTFSDVNEVSGYINITNGSYVRNGFDIPSSGTNCRNIRLPADNSSYGCMNCTFEWVSKPDTVPSDWGNLLSWRAGTQGRRFGYTSSSINLTATSFPSCDLIIGFEQGKWNYIALIFDSKANISIFVGFSDGTKYWKTCSVAGQPLFDSTNGVSIGGYPESGLGQFDGLFDMITISDVTRSRAWVESRYQNILLNYSFFGANQTVSAPTSAPNITNITIIPSLALDTSPLNCTVGYNDTDGNTGTINVSWYNGSTIYSSTMKTSVSHGQSVSFNLTTGIQAIGETWNCSANATDSSGLVSNTNSTTITIQANITFVVRSGEDNNSIPSFNINCSNSFTKSSINSPYSVNFTLGDYSCSFIKQTYFNETVNFSADSDKTINVYLDEIGGLTPQEHDWLESQNSWMEALYNCVFGNTSCILKEINDTVTDVWKYVTKTNRAVVTQEQFISSTLGSSSSIVINYTISIPYKEGYANGELLPLRMYFWFTDVGKTQCYNQDKRNNETQNRAETPFCFPLIAETLGPNNGSVTFNVTLRPNLTAGDYNVTRGIEIDPIVDGLRTWINYGVEDVGQVTVEEGALTPEINLAKTSEIYPSLSTTAQITSMTGNVVNSAKAFLTRSDIVALAGMGMLTFVISLITIVLSITIYKTRKLQYSV